MTSNWCIFRLLVLLLKTSLIINYPITSEPLANNPEHWGESSWIVYEHKNSSLPYKSPINSSKVKKITAKSIFITPDFIMQNSLKECQSGFRIDDNGKYTLKTYINNNIFNLNFLSFREMHKNCKYK